ncbi:MAG: hypothetical protein AAF721_05225 [Myxococcota bacterium]
MFRPGRAAAVLTALTLLTACGDDSAAGDGTETNASTGSDTGMTGGGPAGPDTGSVDTTGDGMTGGSTASMEGGTTTGGSSGEGGSSSDEGSGSTTGEAFDGICVGFDEVATTVSVWGLDAANPGGNCDPDPSAACGGDIVGEWTVDNTCGQEDIPSPFDCDTQDFSVEVTEQSGTIEFEDDGTYTQQTMTTTLISVSLDPMECFDFNCAAWEAALQGQDAGWTCEFDDPDCDCTLMTMGMTDVEGTYETNGSVVTVTVEDAVQDFDYCVEGDRLDLWQPFNEVTVTEESCVDTMACEDALGKTHDAYVCIDASG